jgi:hypothetical protein
MIDNASETTYSLALVELADTHFVLGLQMTRYLVACLYGTKGLEGYSAHIIENSTWINEIKNIRKVHQYYNR